MKKRLRSLRSRSQHQKLNEALEPRLLFAAQVVTQIGSKTLTTGTTPAAISLSTYFDDSVIPSGDTVVEITTNLPAPNNEFPIILTNAATPITVQNFLSYISSGAYTNSFFHRSVSGFIVQGGGYTVTSNGSTQAIATTGTITGESSTAVLHNTTGTIAMALSSGPNSATSEWFFNLANNNGTTPPNNTNLDDTSDGGPFTAFGEVIYNGLNAIDAIGNLTIYSGFSQPFDALPVQNYTDTSTAPTVTNLVTTNFAVDNNPITYSAVSSAAGKVTATITNGSLQLTPVAAGSATITVTATDLGGGTATETIPVTVTAPSVPTVAVGAASGTIGTNSQITFPVTLTPAASAAVTLAYTTTAGTAAAGDFTATTGTLTIPAGATSASVSVPIIKDSTNAVETFALSLSALSNNAVFSNAGSTLSAIGTIDPQAVVSAHPIVSIASASATAVTDSQIVFPVSLSAVDSSAISFHYTTTAGTALAGDFTASTGTVTIPAGATSTTIAVPIIADSSNAAETFTVTLGSLSTNATFAGGAVDLSATGTIEPAPAAATVTAVAASAEAFVLGGTGATFTASVTTAAGAPVTTGSVAFVENGTVVGTVALDSSGDAALTQAFTSTGNLSVQAEYTGNGAVDLSSTSAAVTVSVTTLTPVTGKSTVPTSIVAGTAASGTAVVTVTNSQTATAKGAITVQVYATPTGSTTGSAVLLETVKKSVNLAAGKSVNVNVPVKFKAGAIAAGTYTLISETTDTAGHLSTATAGPTLTVGPATVLFTTSVTRLTAPAKVVAGTKTKAAITLKIANGGNSTSKSPLSISLYASTTGTAAGGTLIRTVSVKAAIKNGKFATIGVPISQYPTVADGDYSIVAVVTDASGNTAAAVSASTVNIAVATVDLAASATTISAAGKLGKAVAVSVTFTNNGNVNATGSVPMLLQLSVSGTATGAVTLGTVDVKTNLAPGKTETAKFKVVIPADFTAGAYFLLTTVDSTNVLNEPSLTDNTVTSAVTISIT